MDPESKAPESRQHVAGTAGPRSSGGHRCPAGWHGQQDAGPRLEQYSRVISYQQEQAKALPPEMNFGQSSCNGK